MIHSEFSNAAENLLIEAKNIIYEASTKNASKVSRLESLGFKRVSEVEELKPLLDKANLSKEQIELVSYYQREYPLNKFITEEQVKDICHRYNLVCGDVGIFTGFVPDKNLKEIESFRLKNKEKDTLITSIGFVLENAEIRNSGNYDHIFIKNDNSGLYAFQRNRGEKRFYSKDTHNLFGLKDKGSITFEIVNNNLKICAPVKDMDIRGLELTEGYKLQKKHIPDPVVLQQVKGGYLILTAWGDEASDELVINQKMN